MDIFKLIECVRSKPQLWDRDDPMYRNIELKNALWEQIYQEMGCQNGDEIKQKWYNLRDVFRREIKNSTNNIRKKKRKWAYYDKMLFLKPRPVLDDRKTSKGGNEDMGGQGDDVPFSMKTEEASDEAMNHHSNPGNSPNRNDIEMLEESMIPITHDSSRNCGSNYENDDYHFAMSIIPHMRHVPAHRKLEMRIKILEVLKEESRFAEYPY